MIRILFALLCAFPAHAQVPAPIDPNRTSTPRSALEPAALVRELRAGGLILYFRHTSTDFSKNDTNSRGPTDCANQRPLTDRGRDEARAIGRAIRELAIPIGEVLAAPTCRTVETGELIFGRARPSADVRGGPLQLEARERYAPLQRLLAHAPARGTNLAITSHGNPFIAVAGPPYLAEGEAAVVRPLGRDFEVLARVRIEDWKALPR